MQTSYSLNMNCVNLIQDVSKGSNNFINLCFDNPLLAIRRNYIGNVAVLHWQWRYVTLAMERQSIGNGGLWK